MKKKIVDTEPEMGYYPLSIRHARSLGAGQGAQERGRAGARACRSAGVQERGRAGAQAGRVCGMGARQEHTGARSARGTAGWAVWARPGRAAGPIGYALGALSLF